MLGATVPEPDILCSVIASTWKVPVMHWEKLKCSNSEYKLCIGGLGCSLVVQHLPSMREALGSIPAPKKKGQKKVCIGRATLQSKDFESGVIILGFQMQFPAGIANHH
jgi:hypothetical protein